LRKNNENEVSGSNKATATVATNRPTPHVFSLQPRTWHV